MEIVAMADLTVLPTFIVIERCGNASADLARLEAVEGILTRHPASNKPFADSMPIIAFIGGQDGVRYVEFSHMRVRNWAALRQDVEMVGCTTTNSKSDVEFWHLHGTPRGDGIVAAGVHEHDQPLLRIADRWEELASMPYREYLKTPEWNDRRKRKLEAVGYACQVCNASGVQLDVHHRTYARRGGELDDDLTVLCHDCHGIFHAAGKVK